MDRDDPNTRRPVNPGFEDDAAFDEQAGEGAPQDEGAWQQEPPAEEPMDDFADPEQAYAEEQVETNEGAELPSYADDEGPIEDEYAQAPLEGEEDGQPSAARAAAEQYLPKGMAGNKANLIKYAGYAGAGVLLLVLGFFGFQQISNMMGGNQQAGVTPPQTAENQQPAQNNQQPTPLSNSEAPPGQPLQPLPDQTAQNTQSILQPSAPQGQPQPGQAQPNALPPPPVNPLEGQVAALNQQLNDMRQNQTRLEEQLKAAQNVPPPPPPVDVKPLQDKIAELEQKLSDLQSKPAAPAKKKAVAKAAPREEQDVPPIASEEKPARHSGRAARRSRGEGKSKDFMASHLQQQENTRIGSTGMPVNNTAQGAVGGGPLPTGPYGAPQDMQPYGQPSPYAQAAPMAVNASGGGWILRSAQPGSAWLSQGMSSDLTRVIPGDKVPGLGTIVSVRMVGGRWLVEGTQGSVR